MPRDTSMLRYKLLSFLFFLLSDISAQVNTDNITIARDKWGVPHIYAVTDKEAAYGLAWAHAEDDFKTIQKTFLPAKGLLGKLEGSGGAVLDYAVHLLRSRKVAERELKNLSPGGLNVIYGYLEGLNAYARKYPEKVLIKNSFPLSIYDYLTGLNLMLHLFSDTGDVIGQLFNNNVEPLDEMSGVDDIGTTIGSNGFAFKSSKTRDGKTYLNVNTHQPLEGPFSWYEAHVNSEEGWNMLGGLFPGLPLPVIGTNENLGWTHTYNYPDMNDIFQLAVNPNDKMEYRLDGKWKKFEVEKVRLKVKAFLGIKLSIRREVLWSDFGPVIKNDKGYFAFFSQSLNNISAIEQWLRMNKAKNFQEFESALKLLGIPRFNIVYADREDNIFYMSNARLSVRDSLVDWRGLVLGDKSSLILDEYHPYEDLPKMINPESGYIFNTNNSPFNSTAEADNLNEADYNSTFSFKEGENNRSLRFMELIGQYDKLSYDDFKEIKYDQKYPDSLILIGNIKTVFELKKEKFQEYAELLDLIQGWDRRGGAENIGAAQWNLYYNFMLSLLSENKVKIEDTITHEYHEQALERTQDHLSKNFGRLDISLGDIQRHIRGGKNLPVSGLIDMIAPTYSVPTDEGRLRAVSGESYIMLIRYTKDGPELETVIPYGNSSDPESPHYTDQMQMYLDKKLKVMSLEREEVMAEALRVYKPI